MKLALLAALAACKSPPPPPPPVVATIADAMTIDAPVAAAPQLPGALYVVRETTLVKLEGGKLVEDFADVGAPLFPSRYHLPDGRVVGIASKGNGEPGSEQLVLIGPGTKVERVGPAITQVREPAVDPKGAWIVVEAKLEPHSELYRIDLATQQSTQLTDNPQGNFTPAVLGGNSIAFASSRDGDSEIYRLDLATKKAQRLTAFHKDDWSPRPSPDGKTIAFLSEREGKPHIYLVDADGTHLRRLTTGDEYQEDEPVWSPDGTWIAYIRANALVIHNATTGAEKVFEGERGYGEPTWSPDGQWIAATRTSKGKTEVVALPASGSAEPIVVATGARLPRWH